MGKGVNITEINPAFRLAMGPAERIPLIEPVRQTLRV